MQKSKGSVPKTEWAPEHFAWALVDDRDVSIKLEEIPPDGSSDTHYHKRSRQFFFVLEGRALMSIDDTDYPLESEAGIDVLPGKLHRIANRGSETLKFLLVSVPRVQPDDIFEG